MLKGYQLFYFEKRDSKDPKGSIDLSVVGTNFITTDVDTTGGKKGPPTPHTLVLIVPGRNFQMCFHTEAEVNIWRAWFEEIEDLLFGKALPAPQPLWLFPRGLYCVISVL